MSKKKIKAVVRLQTGDITITANGAGKDSPYVQSLTVNGKTLNKPWLHFSDINHNGVMSYDLSASPNTSWGSDPSTAPPSYDGGVSADLVPVR